MILPSKSTTTHIETNFDDTGRAEAEAFLSEIEGDGAKAGEVFAEVAAKAESANTGAGELAGRVKALEDRATVVKDSAGHIQAADPAAPDDVATKRYVDQATQNPEAVTASGRGWRATKRAGVVELCLAGIDPADTDPVPEGFLPSALIYIPVSAAPTGAMTPRVALSAKTGAFTGQHFTGKAYGVATYFAQ